MGKVSRSLRRGVSWGVSALTWFVTPAQAWAGAVGVLAMMTAFAQGMTLAGGLMFSVIVTSASAVGLRSAFAIKDRLGSWRRRQADIGLGSRLHVECATIKDAAGKVLDDLWLATFCVSVKNNRSDGKTLRNVSARLHSVFASAKPLYCLKEATREVDIRHGEEVYFEFARTTTQHFIGIPSGGEPLVFPNADIEIARSQHEQEMLWLVCAPKSDPPLNLGVPKLASHTASAVLSIVVSADDVMSSALNIRVEGGQTNRLDHAIRIELP